MEALSYLYHCSYSFGMIITVLLFTGCGGQMPTGNTNKSPLESYFDLRNSYTVRDVSFGYESIELFKMLEEVEKGQLGFSIGAKGEDLTGLDDGDWKKEWCVIGRSSLMGDPIFTDLSNLDYPIYTAAVGSGEWKPKLISLSFIKFMEALKLMEAYSSSIDNVPLDENESYSKSDAHKVLMEIIKLNDNKISVAFWEGWLIPDVL